MHIQRIKILSILLFFIVIANVNAQQNLAQEAYAIFEQSCLICHGENGSYRESLIIEYKELIEGGTVIPGNPSDSVFYQRLIETNIAKRMPLSQPPLAPEAIETIRQWIAAGAPDWNAAPRPKPYFITTDTILETIENHVNSLSQHDRSFARYFMLTHLYNAGETTEALNAYRRALSKLINSLSWGRNVVKPQPIDATETVYYIDLRDYEWDIRNEAWTRIEQAYPYQMTFDVPTQTHLQEKLTTLQQNMNCEVPFVQVDWFLATASLPPLYNDILDLPGTDRELETALNVSVIENLQNAPGKRVWRAGFNDSGVSRHNRIVERHISQHGAYWKSYDFAGSADSQNIFTHPLDFTHDGGEIIFNLPNGLQAYFLIDGVGTRLDVAPTEIVSDPAANDPAVRNGLSCIGCHTEGMKTFEDEVRAVVEQVENPPFNKERVLNLYVEKTVMDNLLDEDTQRYRTALEAAGGVFGGIEPVQRFHEVFQGPLSASQAAATVGLETDAFLEIISKNTTLQNLLGVLVVDGGTVKRDAWTSNFDTVLAELNMIESIEPIPEPIPGAPVNIPDPNLRAAIEEALGKAVDDVITVEDMATLIDLNAEEMGISDIIGLEYAINLRSLHIRKNMITDISPVAGLTQMDGLWLADNEITDISALAGLTNLGVLGIYGNEITDLSPLGGLTNLRGLSVYDNPISSIQPLIGMKNLNWLRMSYEESGDLSPISELSNLESFNYWSSGAPVPDLSPLTNLPKLTKLEILGGGKSDLTPLEKLTSLKEMYIINSEISDISFLKNLIGLERLNLERNNISDVSLLADLTNLKWLKLTNNPITDFSPLAELSKSTNIIFGEVGIPDPNLRAVIAETLGKVATDVLVPITKQEIETLTILRASNRDIKDLTGIEYAINLEELWISKNPVSDISPLSELTNLVGLGVWETPISNLSPLAGLTKLRWLDFGHTPTDANRKLIGSLDLTPLAGITSLNKLTFYACGIQDISPLAGLTGLTHLEVGGNREISDASPVSGLINLERLDFHHDSISDLKPLAGLTKLKYLNLYDNRLISDVSPLAGLTSLTQLRLHRNTILDVSHLVGLINLEILILRDNLISDISPLNGLREHTHIDWLNNPGASVGGPKIEGPWLWLSIQRKRLDSNVDLLAEMTGGSVTETEIATNGATEGEAVGTNQWITHSISTTNRGNITEMLNAIDKPAVRYTVVYGSIVIYSPQEQNTNMFVGAEGNYKIWLNGRLIREDLSYNGSDIHDYEYYLPVTLQQGSNILLVAIDNYIYPDRFEGYFGFEEGTEYTVIPPGVGFTFSATETDNLLVGDTFTLNLNAEMVTDLAGWQGGISFDPNILEAVEVTEGDFLKSEGRETFFQPGTIDNTEGLITNLYSARIAESGVSGTGTLLSVTFKAKAGGETQVTLENSEFSSISGEIIPTVPPNITITVGEYPAWDVNQDGRISIADLVLVARDFGSGESANLRTDVNRDGEINIQDLIIVASHFGETTDPSANTDAAAPNILVVSISELTPELIQAWIDQAQLENDGSLAFQHGIANLQKLLASLLPAKTALLANYPNPFNPETWIPYHLAKPAKVTLTIYAANGTVVRTLTLGHQAAGIYQSRSRAAHWDGKNTVGESVASGIYFYTLDTGNFTATRKMLILK